MKIDVYFSDREKLNHELSFFKKKRLLIKQDSNPELVRAHIDKAKHNLAFFDKNKNDTNFNDWLVVTLYYALYHSALALVVNKNHTSKNHTATLLFLIKHYPISKKEAELIENLSITKNDAEFYTTMKKERHYASYSTQFNLTQAKVLEYKKEVINFIQKVEDMIKSE